MGRSSGSVRGAGRSSLAGVVGVRTNARVVVPVQVFALPGGGSDPRVTRIFQRSGVPVIYNRDTRTWYIGANTLVGHGEMDSVAMRGAVGPYKEASLVRGYTRGGRIQLYDMSAQAAGAARQYGIREATVNRMLNKVAASAERNAPVIRGRRVEISYKPVGI